MPGKDRPASAIARSGEKRGLEAEALAAAIRKHGQKDVAYVADREAIPDHLAGIVRPGDIVLTLGAGNLWQAGEALLAKLQAKG